MSLKHSFAIIFQIKSQYLVFFIFFLGLFKAQSFIFTEVFVTIIYTIFKYGIKKVSTIKKYNIKLADF